VVNKKIKEFLKPDWRRLLIAVILCSIIYGLLFCLFTENECFVQTAVNLLGGLEGFFGGLFDLFLTADIPILEKISAVIISYILSCFIVSIYDKYKKKH
jgi:ABC-type microcin C transport system permease subunit YejE